MYVTREPKRLYERVDKLVQVKKPPTLRMFLINEGDRKVTLGEGELT